jgi:UDP-N-acetylmuramate--alanine ligase
MTRSIAELGGGLAPARPARAIRAGERIHVVGIAGAGASAAALHAASQGAIVTGCDPGGPSPYTAALEAVGIPIAWSHHPGHVTEGPRLDRLAVTKALTAVAPDHPELRAAAARGIPAEPWQQVIADAAFGRRLVAVAGTHGKSTTAGWLTWVLAEAGADPAAFVGALLPAALSGGVPATARLGRGEAFVAEADEYAGNFDAYRPDVVAVTTVDWDHPDVFEDRAAVVRTLADWLAHVPDATIVANLDDPGVVELVELLDRGGHRGPLIGVTLARGDATGDQAGSGGDGPAVLGLDARVSGTIVERTADETVLDIADADPVPLRARLRIAGDHNASNALVALATARAAAGSALGAPDRAAWALSTFPGIGRRLERKGEARGVVIYDDYGHHPTAIRATIAAIRQREPGRPLWAVYEPLTFHRTAAMLEAFADALGDADAVAIADIWAGRDLDLTVTSPQALATAVRLRRPGVPAIAPGNVEQTAAWLAANVREGDAVLVMGGGRSYRIAELLLESLGTNP